MGIENNVSKKNYTKAGRLFVTIFVLSILLGVVIVSMSPVPSDPVLIGNLLSNMTVLRLNIWPVFSLMIICYCMTNNVGTGFLITGILCFIIAEVNRFKMVFRDDPFIFSDVFLFREAKEMTNSYKLFLDRISLLALLFIIFVSVCSFFLFKTKVDTAWKRVLCALFVLALSALTYHPVYQDSEKYDRMWNDDFGNYWKEGNQYMSRGVLYSFLRSIPGARDQAPQGYKKAKARDIIAQYKDADMPTEKKVNIIAVMLEAYSDVSVFDNIEFVEDPYANFHHIQENSYSGHLYTNIFAAGTILTERSFLTGYDNPKTRKRKTESFVRYLDSQGYYTEAMHPAYGWIYNRKNINRYLGFDSCITYEEGFSGLTDALPQEKRYGTFFNDSAFFDVLIQRYLEMTSDGSPYFNFSVTYQNHGPYPHMGLAPEKDHVIRKDEYSDSDYSILNGYISGIAETDMALKKLYDFVNEQEEPIVLVLFGDHKPWLGENNDTYYSLGIDIDLKSVAGGCNYYQTPYVFSANQAAKEVLGRDFTGEGNTVSPMFLMTELFEYMGLEGSAYLNYLSDVKKNVDVINPIYIKKDGEFIPAGEGEGDQQLRDRRFVEYYLRNKKMK